MSNTFTYDQHLWDGMKQVIDRFDEGKRTVRDMSKFLDGRATIDADTAKKLQGLCGKPVVKPEGRTLGTGWQAVRTNTEEQFSTRTTLATVFKELSADLNNYKKEISRQKEQHLATVAGLNRDLEKGKAAVLKAKTLYHQKTQTAETALINYEKSQQDPTVAAKALTKLNTTASKNRKEAEVADQAYQATLQEFQAFQVKFEESMKEILKDFQVIEEKRVVKLKEVIDKIVAAQDTYLSEINQHHETLKVAATKINGLEDVQNFIH